MSSAERFREMQDQVGSNSWKFDARPPSYKLVYKLIDYIVSPYPP